MAKKKKRDLGHEFADNELKKYERELKKQYGKAFLSMKKEADKYFSKFDAQQKNMLLKLDRGDITRQEFISWYNKTVTQNHKYDEMVHTLAQELNHTNDMARDMMTGHMASIYAENSNRAGYEICKDVHANLQFDLVDRRTVERLIRDGDSKLLPKPKHPNKQKDIRWNEKKIRSAINQGIIRGDSVDKIATRLQHVTKMNREASVRTARTLTTQAENTGRLDRWEEASEKYKIQMQKTWMAVLDDRTRDWHAELDGVSVDLDQPFVNSVGEIMKPADPNADPENIYNCRCTMFTSIKGYPHDLSRRQMGKGIENLSYEQWKKEASERASEKKKKHDDEDDE